MARNFYILSFFLVCSQIALSQTIENFYPEKLILNYTPEKIKELNIKRVEFVANDKLRKILEYNQDGQIIKKVCFDNKQSLTSKWTYEYDEKKMRIMTTCYNSDNSVRYVDRYIHDGNNLLIKAEHLEKETLKYVVKFTYDENDKIRSASALLATSNTIFKQFNFSDDTKPTIMYDLLRNELDGPEKGNLFEVVNAKIYEKDGDFKKIFVESASIEEKRVFDYSSGLLEKIKVQDLKNKKTELYTLRYSYREN